MHEYGHVVQWQIYGTYSFDNAIVEGWPSYFATSKNDNDDFAKDWNIDTPDEQYDTKPIEAFAGALWDIRKAFISKYGKTTGWVNADNLIWKATVDTPYTSNDFYDYLLIEDDDNGNLNDGTPNSCEITQAFYDHGIDYDTANPSISITNPNPGYVSGTVAVTTSASDNVCIDKVEFYVDGSLKYTDYTEPYTYYWDTTAYTQTEHTVIAKVYDIGGRSSSDSISVIVDNSPSISEPLNTPSNPTSDDDNVITAIIDAISGVLDWVKLHWWGGSWHEQTWNPNTAEFQMSHNIGPEPAGETVEYYIEAHDTSDGYSRSPSSGYYSFTISNTTGADLTLSSSDISLNPSSPALNQLVTISATIYNNGNTRADNFKVELLIDGVSKANNTHSLNVSAYVLSHFSWITASGNHTLTIKLDPTQEILESNENNNIASKNITVSEGEPQAFIMSFPMPESYNVNETVLLYFTVDNDGPGLIDDELIATVEDYYGKPVYYEEIPLYLEEGEGEFLEFEWKIPSNTELGKYLITLEFEDVDAMPGMSVFYVN